MVPKKLNLKERNFKHFNEREFVETINSIHWDEILQLESNDPNVSLENLYSYVDNLFDEFAPYKKVSKKEFKLKSKPWISKEIQYLMWQRDKLFQKYYKETNLERKELLHVKYKSLRNELTKKKRDSKTNYYQVYFANNSKKVSAIWKGIRMVVKIKS